MLSDFARVINCKLDLSGSFHLFPFSFFFLFLSFLFLSFPLLFLSFFFFSFFFLLLLLLLLLSVPSPPPFVPLLSFLSFPFLSFPFLSFPFLSFPFLSSSLFFLLFSSLVCLSCLWSLLGVFSCLFFFSSFWNAHLSGVLKVSNRSYGSIPLTSTSYLPCCWCKTCGEFPCVEPPYCA